MNSTQGEHLRQGSDSISSNLERRIRAGELREGDRLPSIRSLAVDLGVSPATVASAYGRLRSRGLVVATKQGTVVAPVPEITARRERVGVEGRDVSDGNPDIRLLPDLGSIEAAEGLVLYEGAQELEALLDIERATFDADGVPTEHLVVVGGSHDGVERALSSLLLPGDRVAVEDPGFAGTHDLTRSMGLLNVGVEIDSEGMIPDSLDHALNGDDSASAVIITSRAQNPTGAAISAPRARDLSRLLDRHPDVLVIEDDHAGPVSGAPFFTTVGPDRERWAVVRSFGKYLSPDLRVAVMAGDELTIARVRSKLAAGTGWVSLILQRLAVRGLTDPGCVAMLETARDSYAARRQGLVEALRTRGVEVDSPSGFNVWVPVERETDAWRQLVVSGWVTAPGEEFRIDSPPGLRITVSTLDIDDIDPLADAVASAVLGSSRSAV